MKSIETLARVDVLCVDKTGTITEPKMQVADIRFIPHLLQLCITLAGHYKTPGKQPVPCFFLNFIGFARKKRLIYRKKQKRWFAPYRGLQRKKYKKGLRRALRTIGTLSSPAIQAFLPILEKCFPQCFLVQNP